MKDAEAHPEMAWVRYQWPLVASLAWTGYVDEGRGAVVVEKEEEALADGLRYIAGPVWEDAAGNALIQSYNPRREVVLVIVHDGEETLHLLEALPCPPDAVVTHPVERLRPNERRNGHRASAGPGSCGITSAAVSRTGGSRVPCDRALHRPAAFAGRLSPCKSAHVTVFTPLHWSWMSLRRSW